MEDVAKGYKQDVHKKKAWGKYGRSFNEVVNGKGPKEMEKAIKGGPLYKITKKFILDITI